MQNVKNARIAREISLASRMIKRAARANRAAAAAAEAELRSLLSHIGSFASGIGTWGTLNYLWNRLFKKEPVTPVSPGPLIQPDVLRSTTGPGQIYSLENLVKSVPEFSKIPPAKSEDVIRQVAFGKLDLPPDKATPTNILTELGKTVRAVPNISYSAGYVSSMGSDRKMKIYYSLVALANQGRS